MADGCVIQLSFLLGAVALTALVTVITFIGRIGRGKWWSVIKQITGQLLIGWC